MRSLERKDFDSWNTLKKELDAKQNAIFFHEREIWFCSLGVNIGFEQDGKNHGFARPVLILKKFNNDIFLAVPLSSVVKSGKHYFVLTYENRQYTIILSQIRLLDGKRLIRKIRVLPSEEFKEIIKKIKGLL